MTIARHAALLMAFLPLATLAAERAASPPESAPPPGLSVAADGSFLRPYTNRWKFTIQPRGGSEVEAGIWTDRMEATTFEGRPVLKRTQVAEYKKGIRVTFVNVFDPKSMASLLFDYSRSDTGETRHLELHDRTATFRRSPGTGENPAQSYVATLDRVPLDFYDGLFGILISALPLREGFEATIPAFDSDRACIDPIRVKVAGRETVPAGEGKSVQAWVAQVETRTYGRSTWWLTREAPFVIKARLTVSENEGGATITYTMI